VRMNSLPGKEILALVRDGDYAHPGEESAIGLVFGELPADPGRQVLDVGCGLGGTADYVRRRGWGRVTGVDIDRDTLAAARQRYPEIEFRAADAGSLAELWHARFNLIYLFNAFYAFPDQARALCQMHAAATAGASLMIFDYTGRNGSPHDAGVWPENYRKSRPFNHQGWTPLHPERFPDQLRDAGWEVERVADFSAEYIAWYRRLCGRITAKQDRIEAGYGPEWYAYVLKRYCGLLSAVENGTVGGAAYWARRI